MELSRLAGHRDFHPGSFYPSVYPGPGKITAKGGDGSVIEVLGSPDPDRYDAGPVGVVAE